MARTLQERLNSDPAPGWKPEPGDSVLGTIVAISEAPGTDWGPYPLIEIDREDGGDPPAVAIHAFHSVLKSEIERLQPAEGDRIGVKYLGKKQGNTREYEAYNVVLERVTPRPSTPSPGNSQPAAPATAATGTHTQQWDDEEPF